MTIKNFFILILIAFSVLAVCSWKFLGNVANHTSKNGIRSYNSATDKQAIYKMFKDDWYWLIMDNRLYSKNYVDSLLENKNSAEFSKRNNLVLKVYEDNGNVVGFSAVYKKSPLVGHILFILVDSDARRKGYAKALVKDALSDLFAQGYIKVSLDTRTGNTRARSLYSSIGFQLLEEGEDGVQYVFYKDKFV